MNYDYGFRIHDPRLGRFLSVDPLTKSYPQLTPYQFASNTPIYAIDLDGLEAIGYEHRLEQYKNERLGLTDAEYIEQRRKGGIGMAIGLGVAITLPFAIEYGIPLFTFYLSEAVVTTTVFVSNPSNQFAFMEGVSFLGNLVNPTPEEIFPTSGPGGELGMLAKSAFKKLALGKADNLKKWADTFKANSMFNDGFGLDIPTVLSPSNQILQAMYKTVDDGGKLIFNLKNVNLSAAKKGFSSFDEALENKMITEWELSKILRDEELLKNTIFHNEGKAIDAIESGIQLINE